MTRLRSAPLALLATIGSGTAAQEVVSAPADSIAASATRPVYGPVQHRRLPGGAKPPVLRAAGFSDHDYPTEAQWASSEGTVGATVSVGVDGRATDCAIETSSGDPRLDEATCALILIRSRFSPAQDNVGEPVAGTVAVPVRWVMAR